MNKQNPNFRKEYKCKCGHKGPYILKMGGLLCEACRRILFYPETLEYNEAMEPIKKDLERFKNIK